MECPKCNKEIDRLIHYLEITIDVETHETKFARIWATYCPKCGRSLEETYNIFYGNPVDSRTMKQGDVDYSDVNSKLFGGLLK